MAARNLAHATAQLVRTAAYVASQRDGGDGQRERGAFLQANDSPREIIAASRESVQKAGQTYVRVETHNPASVIGVVCQNLETCTANTSIPQNSDTDCLRIDVELARIAVGLRQSAQLRLWIILQEYARESGYNHLTRSQLATLLEQYHIRYSWQNLHRWLRQGQGVWWNLHNDTVWMIGYERVAKSLADTAMMLPKPKRGYWRRNLIETNTPGMRRAMYIQVSSANLNQFEAQVYAAWHASKDGMPISRFVLNRLWARDTKTLIRWQRLAGIIVINTFVHYTEDHSNYVPHAPGGGYRGGVIEYKVGKSRRWSAEYSNTYRTTTAIRQHPYRGKSRRVFEVIRNMIEKAEASVSTAGQGVVDPDRLIRKGRLIFADAQKARANADNHKSRVERYIDKGFDNRRGRHLEFSPDGRERMRLQTCAKAGSVLEDL